MRLSIALLAICAFTQSSASQEPIAFDLKELVDPNAADFQAKLRELHKKYDKKTVTVTGPVSSLISDYRGDLLFAISDDKDVLSDKKLHKAIAIQVSKGSLTKEQIIAAQGKATVTVTGKVQRGVKWQLIIDADKISEPMLIKDK